MLYKLIRSLYGLESGRVCRRCTEAISRRDPFGVSEGVCTSCRL